MVGVSVVCTRPVWWLHRLFKPGDFDWHWSTGGDLLLQGSVPGRLGSSLVSVPVLRHPLCQLSSGLHCSCSTHFTWSFLFKLLSYLLVRVVLLTFPSCLLCFLQHHLTAALAWANSQFSFFPFHCFISETSFLGLSSHPHHPLLAAAVFSPSAAKVHSLALYSPA